ncbi:MAG: sensor of ECF-type sigma factor [Bacteroidota bacterium]
MKKFYTLLLLFLTVLAFGQDLEDRVERVKALRVAYISDKLNLTPDEAQKFWPVFNQFDERHFELQKQKRKLMGRLRPENASNLSEKETSQLMDEDDKLEGEIQSNRRQLVKNLQGIIPNQKILMLRQIEVEFKQKLLNQIKNRREGRFKR